MQRGVSDPTRRRADSRRILNLSDVPSSGEAIRLFPAGLFNRRVWLYASIAMDTWYIYLLRTRNGALYTGIATDVERRLGEHGGSTTRGARSLRGKGPLELVFQCAMGDRGLAQRVEARIKNLTRDRKEQLIRTDPDADSLLALLALSVCGG